MVLRPELSIPVSGGEVICLQTIGNPLYLFHSKIVEKPKNRERKKPTNKNNREPPNRKTVQLNVQTRIEEEEKPRNIIEELNERKDKTSSIG